MKMVFIVMMKKMLGWGDAYGDAYDDNDDNDGDASDDDNDANDDGGDADDDNDAHNGCSPFYIRPFYLPSSLPTSSR